VQAEEADRSSMLWLYRDAMALRHQHVATANEVEWLDLGPSVVAFGHDGGLRCVVNFGPEPVELPSGPVLLASAELSDGRLPTDTAARLG
jgi:alpha-glucosidase